MRATLPAAILLGLTVLAASVGATVPGPGGSVSSDPVGAPATCTQSFCTQGTGTGPVDTPRVDVCIPSTSPCLLHPIVESVHVHDGVALPAVCASPAGVACRPAETILPAGFIQLHYAVADVQAAPPTVTITTIQDVVLVDQPPVTVVACDDTPCPFPVVGPGTFSTALTFVLVIDGQSFGGTFPLAA